MNSWLASEKHVNTIMAFKLCASRRTALCRHYSVHEVFSPQGDGASAEEDS